MPTPATSRLADARLALPWVALALIVGAALALLLAVFLEVGCDMDRPSRDLIFSGHSGDTPNTAHTHAHTSTNARS